MLSLICASCGNVQDPPADGSPVPTRCRECSGILLVSLQDPAAARRSEPRGASQGPLLPEASVAVGGHPSPFGKYRLDRVIGRGGMGVVYDARDTTLDRRVALKVMTSARSDDPKRAMESWQRFMQEARLSANLPKHPNICTVYEAGVIEDRHRFIAMEFVRGRSFTEWRTTPPKPLLEQVKVLRDVAAAVHHAHEQGIIHRDLKPQNILVDENGRPIVTDFGLAKPLASGRGPSLTPSGFIVGSPAYMSPEQALGRDEVDRRTDVYALGAILYELLAGRPPAEGKNPVELLSRVIEGRIERPSERLKAMSIEPPDPVLERICMKAMARLPSGRHPTAQAMADELTRWLDKDSPTSARRGLPRWVPAAAAAGVLALAAAGAFVYWREYFPSQARAHVERGEQLLRVGSYREAANAFERALEAVPSHPQALRGRDEALRRLDEQFQTEKEARERERRLQEEAEAARRPPLVLDLDTLQPTKTEGYFRRDPSHLLFGSNLTAETSLALPESGEYDIVVTAGCDAAKGEFARFRVYLDGKNLGETTLTGTDARDYKIRALLTGGHHRLGIEFTNDLWEPEKQLDRNLHVHGIALRRIR